WSPNSKKSAVDIDDERFYDFDSRRSSTAYSESRRASVTPDGIVDEELRAYKREERKLKIEYSHIINQTKEETKKHQELTMLIENSRSHLSLQHRAVRTTKMKVREHEQRYRQLLHWLQVVGKVAFEREKDKANALLQRSAKIFEKFKKVQDKVSTKATNNSRTLKKLILEMNSLVSEGRVLEKEEDSLSKSVEELNRMLEEETKAFDVRKAGMELALSKKLQADEANRLLEAKVLENACKKQSKNGKIVDLEELEYLDAIEAGLSKIPYLKDANHLLYANFDNNLITSLRGLDYVTTLNSASFNRNRLMSLDIGNLGNIKFFNANNNNISHVEVSEKAKQLIWLDLSCNPIKDLDSTQSEELNVLDLHNTEIRDFRSAENLQNLIYLNLARTKVPNGPIHSLSESKILQYLSLARNKYSDIPDLDNPLLYILDMDHNFLKRVCVTGWFPRLRILHLNGNKIDYIDSLSTCPFLVELHLSENKIEGNRKHQKREQFEDYVRLTTFYQQAIEDFMGPDFDPYLNYLQGPKDATIEMRHMMQSSRLAWLVSTLVGHCSEIQRVNTFASPDVDVANAAMIELFGKKMIICSCIIAQAYYRRHSQRRKYRKLKRKVSVYLTQQLNAEVIQGRKIRDADKKRKQQENELKTVLETNDTSLIDWASKNHEVEIEDGYKNFLVKQNTRKLESQRMKRVIASREQERTTPGGTVIKKVQEPETPRIEDEVMVLFSQQQEEQGWITTETNEVMHHEELSMNNSSFDTDLVNFNPLKAYLQKADESVHNETIKQESSAESEQTAKPRQYWLQKAAHERMLAARATKYNTSNDPLARLRKVYQNAYAGKPIASLTMNKFSHFTQHQEEDPSISKHLHIPPLLDYSRASADRGASAENLNMGALNEMGSRPLSASNSVADDASSVPVYRATKIKPIISLSLAAQKKAKDINVIYQWDIGAPSRIQIPKSPVPQLPKLPKIREQSPKLLDGPAKYSLVPTFQQRYPKPKAIITILPTFPQNVSSQYLDYDTISILAQACTFQEWLKSEMDTEYVTIMSDQVPIRVRQTLVSLGARIIVVPNVASHANIDLFVYLKLQMWKLEGVYESILYIDKWLQFMDNSPVQELWSLLEKTRELSWYSGRKLFFGATKPWTDCCGPISTELMLFTPSLKIYGELEKLAVSYASSTATLNKHLDQQVIGQYFLETKKMYTEIPQKFNTMDMKNRSPEEKSVARGIHQNFWGFEEVKNKDDIYKFDYFQRIMMNLRAVQMQIRSDAAPGRQKQAPIVPAVGGFSFEESKKILEAGDGVFDSVAVVSLGGSLHESVAVQRVFANRNYQATHFNIEIYEGFEYQNVFNVIHKIMLDFEWVLVLHPVVFEKMESSPLPILVAEAKKSGKDLVLFNDCHESFVSGSFMIRQRVIGNVVRLQHKVIMMQKEIERSGDLWSKFLESLHGNFVVKEPFFNFTKTLCNSKFAFEFSRH
ncbi:UNVERIFIED_CONTAM: hypothetical protein HDU68_005235, partial [Siphonaria sp. JEL0065]